MLQFRLASPSTAESNAGHLFPAVLNEQPYKDLLAKWGFLQSGEWSLQQYHYAYVREDATTSTATASATEPATAADAAHLLNSDKLQAPSKSSASQSSPITAAALRFHHGMAHDFLHDLFASPVVQAQLRADEASARQQSGHHSMKNNTNATELLFRPLTCQWTTLGPLRQKLVDGKVVRQVRPLSRSNTNTSDDEGISAVSKLKSEGNTAEVRLPTVKCAEELLPHGEVICDELRALFLQAHNRSCPGGYDFAQARAGFVRGKVNCDGEADDVNSSSNDDEDGDEDMWGTMAGAKLPLKQLRGVFDRPARAEFLYHVVWRLIAGSGPLNQFEDDAAVYLDVARQLYRGLITSFHVREVTSPTDAVAVNEGDVTELEDREVASTSKSVATRYEAVVDALVYEVLSVPGVCLFPFSDDVAPSKLNYCYVVVNPTEQMVCVWYHHC